MLFGRTVNRLYGLARVNVLSLALPAILYLCPHQVYRFTNDIVPGGNLPTPSSRLKKGDSALEDFFIYAEGLGGFDGVNIVMRGSNAEYIDKSLPTFFVNPLAGCELTNFSDPYFITADGGVLADMLGSENGRKKYCSMLPRERIIFVHTNRMLPFSFELTAQDGPYQSFKSAQNLLQNNLNTCWGSVDGHLKNRFIVYHKSGTGLNIGSGLSSIVAILSVSRKAFVYGWDQYLKSALTEERVARRALWPGSIFSRRKAVKYLIINLACWHYGFRLMKELSEERAEFYGNLSGIRYVDWVGKELPRLFYDK